MRILLSRTDSIGDVILTLPMTGMIKKHYPNAQIDFLGKSYTKDIISCSQNVDQIHDWSELSQLSPKDQISFIREKNYDVVIHVFPVKEIAKLMKGAKVPKRVGTRGRIYHLLTCNSLIKFTRRRSDLHEAQLNMKLLEGVGISEIPTLTQLPDLAAFKAPELHSQKLSDAIDKKKFNLILHPKSQGSAVEWGLKNFSDLIERLPEDNYQIFITGTEGDKKAVGDSLPFDKKNVTDLMGKVTLKELISFISKADGLVAASTGPLHIAGILNKVAVGLFSPRRPIHPGRWAPIGEKTSTIVNDENCKKCVDGNQCDCINSIDPQKVIDRLNSYRA